MAVTEQARHRLYQYFEETMGEERAATMMELLPPVGWGDVAMKTDIAGVRTDVLALKTDVAALKRDVAALQTDVTVLKIDVAALQTDVAALKADMAALKADMAVLKTDVAALKPGIAAIEQRMEREMVTKAEFERGLRTMLARVIAANVAIYGVAVGALAAIVG